MPGVWHNVHIAIIAPAMATKRKAYAVTTKLQRRGRKNVNGGSCNVGEELPVNCEYGNV